VERIAIQTVGKRALRQSDFAQAVVRHTPSVDPRHPMFRTWIEYPLGTNDRGEEVVRTVQRYHPQIAGARSLDIGCAYGGTPIALARAGVEATGIEIDPGFLELAKANLQDHLRKQPELACTLLVGDMLQPTVAEPLGMFDIITCDNVIEHVEKASTLIDTIARVLTSPDGVCVMGIPNAFSVLQVKRDGHYALFGLTLLERDDAITYFSDTGHTDGYSVGEYCFTLEDYRQMFEAAGLTMELLHPPVYSARAVEELMHQVMRLRATLATQASNNKIPSSVGAKIEAALARYIDGFQARYQAYCAAPTGERAALGNQLLADYQDEQWQVLARHRQ
jgi:2-polyprenyl-3-methyl-5-hydroxy-6-metoxy-1,4-benzoquinol methylase